VYEREEMVVYEHYFLCVCGSVWRCAVATCVCMCVCVCERLCKERWFVVL